MKAANYAKQNSQAVNAVLNAARRQTIPAFRQKGSWMIGVDRAAKG